MSEKIEEKTSEVETVTVSREEFDNLVNQLKQYQAQVDAKFNSVNDAINLTRTDLTAKLQQSAPVNEVTPTKSIDDMTDDELPTW